MNNYKIIILIIASDDPEYYTEMQKIWKLYMNNHPDIRSFFIKNNKVICKENNIFVDENTIYINNDETYIPGILKKTIESIKYIDKNYDYKYIFRSNLSSLVNLDKLYEYSNNDFDYSGVIGNHNNINFCSGSGFFLSNKAVNYIINNENKIDYSLIDDVSIGKLLSNNFNLTKAIRYDIINLKKIDKEILEKHFHYRCKDNKNHKNTLNYMNYIYNLIYK